MQKNFCIKVLNFAPGIHPPRTLPPSAPSALVPPLKNPGYAPADHPQQKKMTLLLLLLSLLNKKIMSGVSLCRFSRWRISAILDFKGFFEKPMYDYRSSIETIALNCLVFEKIAFFPFWRQDPRQTDEQMDSTDALSRSRCRERRLKNNEAEHSVLGHLVNVRSRSSYRSGLRSE